MPRHRNRFEIEVRMRLNDHEVPNRSTSQSAVSRFHMAAGQRNRPDSCIRAAARLGLVFNPYERFAAPRELEHR
jgi:hypothetical protein